MSNDFALQVERLADGSLDAEGRRALAAAVAADPACKATILEQLSLAQRLSVLHRTYDAEDTWRRIELLIHRDRGSQRIRAADAVLARLGRTPPAAGKAGEKRHSRRLSARRADARRTFQAGPWFAAAAALAAAIAVAAILTHEGNRAPAGQAFARLGELHGQVELHRGDETVVVNTSDPVLVGDRLALAADASAEVVGDDLGEIDLDRGAGFVVVDGSHARLDAGRMHARIVHRTSGHALAFVTPQGRAEIVGTVFTLDVDTSRTRLDVTEGRVRLTRARDGASALVATGEWAEAGDGRELVAHGSTPPPKPAAKPEAAVVAFALIDTATGRAVPGHEQLHDGDVLELARLPRGMTVWVTTEPASVGQVSFTFDGAPMPDQRTPPYSFTRWDGKRYAPLPFTPGTHRLSAWPHLQKGGPRLEDGVMALSVTVR